MAKAKVHNLEVEQTQEEFIREKELELESQGVPWMYLYDDSDNPVKAFLNFRERKLFIAGDTHKKFAELIAEKNKAVKENSMSFEHLQQVLSIGSRKDANGVPLPSSKIEQMQAEYMLDHVNDVMEEIANLSSRIDSKDTGLPLEQANIDFKFNYDAIRLILSPRSPAIAVSSEIKTAMGDMGVHADFKNEKTIPDFWLKQNYDEIKRLVTWFRKRLGL